MNRIEYIVMAKQEGLFCNSKSSFISLLQVDSSIKINNNIMSYKHEDNIIDVEFNLVTNEIKLKQERFFHITLINKDELKNALFTELARKIKRISLKINTNKVKINTIWDDIGRSYAIQAYPLVNEVENLMRKLITQFMLVNVGMEWSSNSLHENLQGIVGNTNNINELHEDDLFKTNFIDLVDVLFTKYRTLSTEKMNELLNKTNDIGELNLKQLKEFLPKSNWERHFSEKIQYHEEKLKTKWKILYELRNNIAHNRYLKDEDYKKIKGITLELKKVIIEAIDNLNNITLTEVEKEDTLETYRSGNTALNGYIAEEAVAKYYMKKFNTSDLKSSEFMNRGNYDFLITLRSNIRIAVEVKYLRRQSIQMIIKKEIERYVDSEGFNEKHLVLVINDIISNASKYDIDSISTIAKGVPFKLIVGYLNAFNEFIEIENIMENYPLSE